MSAPKRPERRKKQRVQLTRGLLARFGAMGAVILDITDAGARIEHLTRLDVGKHARFRFEWQGREIQADAEVRSCKVHRFAHGDDGTTVYQSGLLFVEFVDDATERLRELVATSVARSLAEQVANARGIGPVIERNMPVFRSGVVASGEITPDEKTKQFIPESEVVVDRGYVRCTLINGRRWEKKWSRTPEQPTEGFTVRATESDDHVDQLCETYMKGTPEDRELIRLFARVSVEKMEATPEPIG